MEKMSNLEEARVWSFEAIAETVRKGRVSGMLLC